MTFETLLLERDARGVATLTLNRPEKHNALSARLIDDLARAAAELAVDERIRVIVITGAGESFCAGADLGWMRAQFDATRRRRMDEARRLSELFQTLDTLPKPVIGRINGQAYGGGVGVMSVCDLCIGVEGARFGLTETPLGLIPATITRYVAARIGAAGLRRVALSGRRFDAAVAKDLGLLGAMVDAADLDDAIEKELGFHLRAAPGAIAATKRLIKMTSPRMAADLDAAIALLADQWESAEAQEGVTAFFEKRAPSWRQ